MQRETDRQTQKLTDGRGQYTFRLGYASRGDLKVMRYSMLPKIFAQITHRQEN